jgi:uncharacterized repeat protein (TIGR03803 family)
LTVLKDFSGDPADVEDPYAGLALSGNTLYGTSYSGGSSGNGTVFKVNTDGSGFAVLKGFTHPLYNTNSVLPGYTNNDGASPEARLTLAGGILYGTATSGGTNGQGVVFKLNTNGTGYAVLRHFAGTSNDGANPKAGLVLSGSTLYGTTYYGGTSNRGTVFKLDIDGGNYAVLWNFTGSTNDGAWPTAGLVLSGNALYGTTSSGGSSGSGTVFNVNTNGTGFSVLKSFSSQTYVSASGVWTNIGGAQPRGEVLLAGSALYGTTSIGGSNGFGTVFKLNTDGSGFAVLRDLAPTDGSSPISGLLLSGNTLYGTAYSGGISGSGTVFSVGTNGSDFTVLASLSGSNGAYPFGGLVRAAGTLYGNTLGGGSDGIGTVFALTAPISLSISSIGSAQVLRWSDSTFGLQSAPIVGGTFTNVPGATSPYTNRAAGLQQYFRLKAN